MVDAAAIEMWWAWHVMEKSGAFFNCYTMHYSRVMASPHLVDQRAVCWIWVCCFHSYSSMILKFAQLGYLPRRRRESEDEECVHGFYMYYLCLLSYLFFKAMYQFYQVMICLLKFDFFAFTGVTMQVSTIIGYSHPLLTSRTFSCSSWCWTINLQSSVSQLPPFPLF